MENHIELPLKPMTNKAFLQIAKLGRTVGLKGDLKLYYLCDFPEQFKSGAVFQTEKRGDLKVLNFDENRMLIRFKDYENLEDAKKLINTILLTTEEETKKNCILKEDEFFWFDIVGLDIVENDKLLGRVDEIQRIGEQDFLHVKTDKAFLDFGLSKEFLIPYIDRFIIKTDLNEKKIHVRNSLDLLQSL